MILPVIASFCVISGYTELALCLIVTAIAALAPDVDCSDSTINRKNPLTGIPIKVSEFAINLFLYLIRFCIVALVALIAWQIGKRITGFETALLVILFLLTFIALFANRIVAIIPEVGYLYKLFEEKIYSLLYHMKRAIIILVYSGMGIFMAINNYLEWQDPVVYIMSAILVVLGFFQHRTFMHAPEGFILMSFCAIYLLKKVDMLYLGIAFMVGYFSHLYLSDALTPSGVPVSFIPTLLRGLKIHDKLMEKPLFKKVIRFLDKRIALRLIRTGSSWEGIYVIILIVICVIEYVLFRPYTFF